MPKLKILIMASALLSLAHFIEEAIFNFYQTDASTKLIAGYTGISAFSLWIAAQIFLVIIYCWLWFGKERSRIIPFILLFIIFVVELHHPFEAIRLGEYVPGLITSFLFPVLGYFWITKGRAIFK